MKKKDGGRVFRGRLKDEPTSLGTSEAAAFRAINVAALERIDIIAPDRRSEHRERRDL